jgi:hypothetical protein
MKKLSELFDVRYGHSLELNHLKLADSERGIAFVSRKNRDNGVSAFVEPVEGEVPASPGKLTVALGGQGGALSTFLQERPFYTGRDVAILSSKGPLSKAALLFYCVCIKANRYRYGFGRQANRTLKDLLVPEPHELPAWVDEVVETDLSGKDAPAVAGPTPNLNTPSWKPFKLTDLFEVKKGCGLPGHARASGTTPYIGALDRDNGLVDYIAQSPTHPAGTLTLNWNGVGGVGVAFYQPADYWCSGDVNALYPRFEMTTAVAMFLITVIRKERYRYSFGRKWTLGRLATSVIRLPVKDDGSPDWDFMERYVKTLPFSSQI